MKKPKIHKERIAVYLPDRVVQWVNRKAEALQSNPSAFIRLALVTAMEHDNED